MDGGPGLNELIASRVAELRTERGLSLEALSSKCGVSRSMLSLIERGESSPTAVVLEKVATALGVTLASLFDAAAAPRVSGTPVARRDEQLEWRDPGSGYVRRSVTPPGVAQPMRIVEVRFPAGARVAFDNGSSDTRVFQQVWMLAGSMNVTVGREQHRLSEGDCLAMELDVPTMFHNPTKKTARYAVVVATENTGKR